MSELRELADEWTRERIKNMDVGEAMENIVAVLSKTNKSSLTFRVSEDGSLEARFECGIEHKHEIPVGISFADQSGVDDVVRGILMMMYEELGDDVQEEVLISEPHEIEDICSDGCLRGPAFRH